MAIYRLPSESLPEYSYHKNMIMWEWVGCAGGGSFLLFVDSNENVKMERFCSDYGSRI